MKSLRNLAIAVAFILIITPLAACAAATPLPAQHPTLPSATQSVDSNLNIQPVSFKPVDQLTPDVSSALSGFSLDLFQRMEAQDAGKNVFISPLSVWLALGMTYNGASGSTAQGFAQALHATGISLDDLNKANAGLMGVLTAADPKVQLSIANSIWMKKEYATAFSKAFLDCDRQYYAAQVQALDFSDAGAADTINNWVSQNTNGNIKKLVDPPVDPSTVMFLINAVHFKAPWKVAFDPKSTRDDVFTTSGGTQAQAKFLYNEDGNVGFTNNDVVAARIPYASGRLEMVAVMPKNQKLADFIKGLTAEKLQSYIDQCGDTPKSLLFPKFTLEYSANLNGALQAMGMQDAFDASKADFTNMSPTMGKQLVISDVKHKSFIQVDEQGTEASAATSVEVRLTAVLVTENLEFTKPFVYIIRDSKTGAMLFMGTMENPS